MCHFEVYSFAKYWVDCSSNYRVNQLQYPEGTNYDFSIDDFREMLECHKLKYSDQTLQYLKDKLITDKCVSNIYTHEVDGVKHESQIIIILKEF